MHLSPRRGGYTSGNQLLQSNRCPIRSQGVPETFYCGTVAGEHLSRNHRLKRVLRADSGQTGEDDVALSRVGFGSYEVGSRMHISAPRDFETLVCARGAKLSLKSLSKRLESPRRGSRGLIYDLPATARPARIQGVAGFGGRSGRNAKNSGRTARSGSGSGPTPRPMCPASHRLRRRSFHQPRHRGHRSSPPGLARRLPRALRAGRW
jgi:hypothetical protein